MGTVASHDVGPRRSLRRRLVTLAAVMGPGLIVMAGDNDAGGLSGTQHATWTMPWSERVRPPDATWARTIGLVLLRAYLSAAAILVIVRAIELAVGR